MGCHISRLSTPCLRHWHQSASTPSITAGSLCGGEASARVSQHAYPSLFLFCRAGTEPTAPQGTACAPEIPICYARLTLHLGWDPKQGQGLHTVWVKRGRRRHIQGEKEKRRKGEKEKNSEMRISARRSQAGQGRNKMGTGGHKWSRRIA